MRTTRNTVDFTRSFTLRGLDGSQPAGRYVVDTDEELIEGLSRIAYRRVATTMHVPLKAHGAASLEMIAINPDELAAALMKDARRLVTIVGSQSA